MSTLQRRRGRGAWRVGPVVSIGGMQSRLLFVNQRAGGARWLARTRPKRWVRLGDVLGWSSDGDDPFGGVPSGRTTAPGCP